MRTIAIGMVLCALAGPAAASDLADDPDAAKVEELVRKDDWAGARAIWQRRGEDAAHDIGSRWRALERYFGSGEPRWTESAHRARCVAMLAVFLDRDHLGEDACRIARDKAKDKERPEMAWWTAITLTRLNRLREAAPFFVEGAVTHAFNERAKLDAAELVRLSSRMAEADPNVGDRIALAKVLCGLEADDLFAARAASGMLRRTLATLSPEDRTASLCATAFSAALTAHDASDLRSALAAWEESGADVAAGVAAALNGWKCGDSEPFAGVVARVAQDVPLGPRTASTVARAASRFDPTAAESMFRKAAAYAEDPKADLTEASTDAALDAIAAINARATLARLCARRRQFAEAIEFWKRVRPYGGCGNCAFGQASRRALGVDACRIALGQAHEVFLEASEPSPLGDDFADWTWTRVRAASASGQLDEWLAAGSDKWPLDTLKDQLADALALERMRRNRDVDGLTGEVLAGKPLSEGLWTPEERAHALGEPDRRVEWRRDTALDLLRDFDGGEVEALAKRFGELPVVPPTKPERGSSFVAPRESQRAWIVVALANSRSTEATKVLADLREQVIAGKDVGVSARALGHALELARNDLLWVR